MGRQQRRAANALPAGSPAAANRGIQARPWASAKLLHNLFGVAPGQGTPHTAAQECAAQLQPVEEIEQGVQQAAVAHVDESGLRAGKRRGWLHVARTTALTFYAYHTGRGKVATHEIGILPGFDGRAIHHGLTSYSQ